MPGLKLIRVNKNAPNKLHAILYDNVLMRSTSKDRYIEKP